MKFCELQKEPLKIVQFIASDGYGGAEKVFIELSNGLAERHTVIALVLRCFPIAHRDRFSENVHIVELRSHPTVNNPFLHYELFKMLQSIQPDLVHTHASKATVLVNRVNTFNRVPHLGTKHNDRKGRVFNKLRWVSTVSEEARRSIYPRSDAYVEVIYNGVEKEPVALREKPETFTLLGVGRLDAIKGFDYLLRALAPLPFDYKLIIVGEGPEHGNLTRLIIELGIEDKVELAGFREDIPQMMRDAHMVVISSHREGGPKVMVESLCYASVLVSTPVGAVPEVIPAKFQASLDALGDKISEVYQDYPSYVLEFSKVREQKKSVFLLEDMVKHYEKVFYTLLAD